MPGARGNCKKLIAGKMDRILTRYSFPNNPVKRRETFHNNWEHFGGWCYTKTEGVSGEIAFDLGEVAEL